MRFKSTQILLPIVATMILMPIGAAAQQNEPQPEPQRAPLDDPIRQLNLTPEQRVQIRSIRQQSQEERATINRRLRQANQALEQTLDEDNPDEDLVEQRVREVALLQAAQMRLRVLSEVRIRRVLNAQQRELLRRFRLARRPRRERNDRNPRQDGFNNLRRLPNQQNGLNQSTRPIRP
ncbi:MAG TPA: periplasmic heavy metal sensor [Pyrinomonadaceae bacterium]|nr:periplasmic heavy metal sensor [Pyrinomonadaceae bacterium]